jgi:hypothetical protein
MLSFNLPMLLAVIAQTGSPDLLNGIVQDDGGKPVAGAAVFISTAAPRTGLGVL